MANSSSLQRTTGGQSQKLPLIPQAAIKPKTRTGAAAAQAENSWTRHEANMMRKAQEAGQQEVWSSMEELFWDHMREVQNKWATLKLNDDIWAKLIYFEQNRRLAKAYVSAPVLTVDGSTHGLDGFRIGLSGIDNAYRSLDSMACLRSIGLGVRLRIDSQGNILIRRLNAPGNHCSVWFRDWPRPSSKDAGQLEALDGQENRQVGGARRQLEQPDVSYKLFDMRKFRLRLERQRLGAARATAGGGGGRLDWRQCVSIIGFERHSPVVAMLAHNPTAAAAADQQQPNLRQSEQQLEEPCWLMLINIIAIDMIKSAASGQLGGSSSALARDHALLAAHDRRATAASSSALYVAAASSDRAKRPRRASSRHRASPRALAAPPGSAREPPSSPRRYQSIQQLSSSGSLANAPIYTTFDAKLGTNRRAGRAPSASTTTTTTTTTATGSDYNSRSSVSSLQAAAYNHQHQLHLFQRQQLRRHQQHLSNYRYDDGRILIPMTLQRDSANNNLTTPIKSKLSLSASDVRHAAPRRFDLRAMQSSIKMNYDHLSEGEDAAGGYQEVEVVEQEEIRKEPLKEEEASEKQEKPEQQQQQVSRSSIASTSSQSSSSGCADNDYFLSHSSSSMASTAGSHESELFSQPASSSGIAGSSTSDEGDESRKQQGGSHEDQIGKLEPPSTKTGCNPTTVKGGGELEKRIKKDVKKTPVASGRIISSGRQTTAGDNNSYPYCCSTRVPTATANGQLRLDYVSPLDECQCQAELEEFACDCCGCSECGYSPPLGDCGCQTEAAAAASSPTNQSTATIVRATSGKKREPQLVADSAGRISSSPSAGSLATSANTTATGAKTDDRECDPAGKANSKAAGQPNKAGWLERRKYSRILPKFMFSSQSSNNNNNNRRASQQSKTNNITQYQAAPTTTATTTTTTTGATEDNSNNKFRLTKSSLDLT